MSEKVNDINGLINEAIDASIEFEALMDSIDFNSYLEKEEQDIRDTPGYKIYEKKTDKASKCLENIINNKIDNEIKEDGYVPKPEEYPTKFTQWIIFKLFKAKEIRIEARKQTRKKEEKKYIDATHELHKAFDFIPKDKFYDTQKRKSLADNFNWAKILYYNELAICYSGLAESSMSLGYAERSISLLKEIYPKIGSPPEIDSWEGIEIQDIKLYTFALYNKGEAQRLLHNDDLSLRTFKSIIEIYECKNWRKEKPSDYYSALLRMALILIDQGRGEEALDLLKKVENLEADDYRKEEHDMEKSSALIDQKKFEEASEILIKYKDKKQWGFTFTFRKASLYRIRCFLEWRKNKPTEFKKEERREWKEEYENIPKKIKGGETNNKLGLIVRCIDRNDGDNFQKACKYFSEFHKLENEKIKEKQSKENNGKAKELKNEELWGYFLYLFYEKIYENNIKDLKDMLQKSWKDLKLQQDEKYLDRILDKIEDTKYMQDFFDSYRKYLKSNQDDNDNHDKEVIAKLYKRLRDLYREEDKLQKMEEIERDYNAFNESLEAEHETDQNLKDVAKFITTRFFKTIPPKNKQDRIYLSSNTIENRMHRNIDEFADKILGSSKHILPSGGNRINGILTVLRRWNSFTPSISSSASPSKGGGYFLYFKDGNSKSRGIVIDPGFDFLDNLFFEGFTISDIDVVLISHAHPDHTDNFPKMLTLFHEMNGRLKEWKKKTKEYDRKHIKLILSQGVFDLFSPQMDFSKESLKDIYVVDTKAIKGGKPIECYKGQIGNGKELKIEAFRTSHGDLSQWESIGFLFNIENNEPPIKIGFTSDARWTNEFWRNFNDCSIICVHLGAIVNILDNKGFCNTFCEEFQKNDNDNKCKELDKCQKSNFSGVKVGINELRKQTRDENHLYLAGLTSFFNPLLNGSNLKLGIISEFGEELKGGIRMDLYHKFDDWFQKRKGRSKSVPKCLPGDIGLRVDIFSGNVFCQVCERYVDCNKITPIAYGKEEAIFFVCDECKSVLSTYQIEEKLKDYCENGRKLELTDESK